MSDQPEQKNKNKPEPGRDSSSGESNTAGTPRRSGRRRGGRGRTRPAGEPGTQGEPRQSGEPRPQAADRSRTGSRQRGRRRQPGPNNQQRVRQETAAPEMTGSESERQESGRQETGRQPRPDQRRRKGYRPDRARSDRPAQGGQNSTAGRENPRSADAPERVDQPAPRPSGEGRLQNENRAASRRRGRRGQRGPRSETGRSDTQTQSEREQQGQKSASGPRDGDRRAAAQSGRQPGQRSRPPGEQDSGKRGTGVPERTGRARRNTGRRAPLNKRGSRPASRIFSPGRDSESDDWTPSGEKSTYVSLLGRFNPRPAPSTPIRTDRGIKARSQRGSFSQNWWAQRWIESMEQLVDPARLQRGRSYARSGQVLSLQENPYGVEARVQGSRPAPYKVIIQVTPLTDEQWELVIDAMAEQALFTAQLLAGEMPSTIEDAFETAGVSLFPKLAGDLYSTCSCPDWANPCKHVAATHYILADRFDDDPFLLFRMRGRSQDEILAGLNQRRGGQSEAAELAGEAEEVELEEQPSPEDLLDHFWEPAESLDTFPLTIKPPSIDMPLLTRLGEPNFLPGLSLLNILRPVYERFTYAALRAAYSEEEPVESNPAEPDPDQGSRLANNPPGEVPTGQA